jgi:hypothetical protein
VHSFSYRFEVEGPSTINAPKDLLHQFPVGMRMSFLWIGQQRRALPLMVSQKYFDVSLGFWAVPSESWSACGWTEVLSV